MFHAPLNRIDAQQFITSFNAHTETVDMIGRAC